MVHGVFYCVMGWVIIICPILVMTIPNLDNIIGSYCDDTTAETYQCTHINNNYCQILSVIMIIK